jgi:hypothetical protein
MGENDSALMEDPTLGTGEVGELKGTVGFETSRGWRLNLKQRQLSGALNLLRQSTGTAIPNPPKRMCQTRYLFSVWVSHTGRSQRALLRNLLRTLQLLLTV